MHNFYFDESIHAGLGCIVGCVVFSQLDLTPIVGEALSEFGLDPERDEFKSRFRFQGDEKARQLRLSLYSIIRNSCRIGVVVLSLNEREQLGSYAVKLVKQILRQSRSREAEFALYVDEGIKLDTETFTEDSRSVAAFSDCNSKVIRGIQLADLCAHTCAMILKERHTGQKKIVRVPGYTDDPEFEMNLGFELWARLRYNFFGKERQFDENASQSENAVIDVSGYGLLVSPNLDLKLREVVSRTFGEMYVGCIH